MEKTISINMREKILYAKMNGKEDNLIATKNGIAESDVNYIFDDKDVVNKHANDILYTKKLYSEPLPAGYKDSKNCYPKIYIKMAEYGISYRDIANGAQVSIGTVQNVLYGTSNLDQNYRHNRSREVALVVDFLTEALHGDFDELFARDTMKPYLASDKPTEIPCIFSHVLDWIQENKISLLGLANACGVSTSTVRKLLTGRVELPADPRDLRVKSPKVAKVVAFLTQELGMTYANLFYAYANKAHEQSAAFKEQATGRRSVVASLSNITKESESFSDGEDLSDETALVLKAADFSTDANEADDNGVVTYCLARFENINDVLTGAKTIADVISTDLLEVTELLKDASLQGICAQLTRIDSEDDSIRYPIASVGCDGTARIRYTVTM